MPSGATRQLLPSKPNFRTDNKTRTKSLNDFPKIGFPPGTLANSALRLDVVALKNGVYAALNKPADMLFDAYPGAPKMRSVMQAIRAQGEKPEFARFGLKSPYSVCQSDFEVSGAALLAMDKGAATRLRNAAWSGLFDIEYLLLTRRSSAPDSFKSELPILMHENRPVWIVSHRFGKKAETSFTRLKVCRDCELWRAKAKSARPHQVRVHAAESGLKIIGEEVYARGGYVYLSNLKDDYRPRRGEREEPPLYPHLALHCAAIKMKADDALSDIGDICAEAPLPRPFAAMLKRLGLNA